MSVVLALVTAMGSTAIDATPIVIRELYVARVEDRTYNFECPGVKAHANFSRRNDEIFGSIRAVSDKGLVEFTGSQESVFGQLSIVDDISVSCVEQNDAFKMLVSGYTKDGGEEVILELSYSTDGGFDRPQNILR